MALGTVQLSRDRRQDPIPRSNWSTTKVQGKEPGPDVESDGALWPEGHLLAQLLAAEPPASAEAAATAPGRGDRPSGRVGKLARWRVV